MDAFFGRDPTTAAWRENEVKGSLVRHRAVYLREHAPDRTDDLLRSVSRRARELMSAPPPASVWVPYTLLVELDEVLFRDVMRERDDAMRAFGARIAHDDLRGVHRAFLRLAGPSLFLRGFPLIYGLYFRPGAIDSTKDGDTFRLTLRGNVVPRYMCRQGFTGFIEETLRLAGGSFVLDHDRCFHDDGAAECSYLVRTVPP